MHGKEKERIEKQSRSKEYSLIPKRLTEAVKISVGMEKAKVYVCTKRNDRISGLVVLSYLLDGRQRFRFGVPPGCLLFLQGRKRRLAGPGWIPSRLVSIGPKPGWSAGKGMDRPSPWGLSAVADGAFR